MSILRAHMSNNHSPHFENNFDLQKELIQNPASTYFMRAGSNAMCEAGINKDDMLVVDKALPPKHKDIVVAVQAGNFLLRRLYKANERIELHAECEGISPVPYLTAESLDVWGVVVGVVRKC